ncbi:MAG: integrase core domain-containing protein [Saprospiraceae bacterium]
MEDLELQISVARNCLDNGFAEQRNGLLKHHLLTLLPPDLEGPGLVEELSKIIHNYNHKRKQAKLGWMSPVEYENYWEGRSDRPKMEMYDREQGERTRRFGF